MRSRSTILVLSVVAAAALWPALLGGCTPVQYAGQADRAAYTALDGGQNVVFGSALPFQVSYRPHVPTREAPTVIQVGNKAIPISSATPVVITPGEALEIAFANARSLQDQKEALYSQALALASARRSWNVPLFEGMLTGDADRFVTGGSGATNTGAASTEAGLTQRFVNGAVMTLAASLDLATDFLGSRSTLVGSLIEANITQPLLQGAWNGFAYEDQYRRERDFVFAVFRYERFRQTFAAGVVTQYFGTLQRQDATENERVNIQRLRKTVNMTRALVKGGQVSPIQLDQAEQNYLNAQVRVKRFQQTYEDALDAFKIALGLPIRASIVLDYPGALKQLARDGLKPIPFQGSLARAVTVSLRTRPDVLTRMAGLRDANRDIEIAVNQFLPILDVTLGVSAASAASGREFWAVRFGRHTRSAAVEFSYDLDQTENRDAYRNALISRDRTERDLVAFLDGVDLEIRQAHRELVRSRQTYGLQKTSVRIATRRRKLARKQQQAGEASARDVLEAEAAALTAQNGLTNALVSYVTTRLEFLASLGLIRVDAKGAISELSGPATFERVRRLYPYVDADAHTSVTPEQE